MPTGRELSDTRAWVEHTQCAIPQAGVAAKPCRSNEGWTALCAGHPSSTTRAPLGGAKRRPTSALKGARLHARPFERVVRPHWAVGRSVVGSGLAG